MTGSRVRPVGVAAALVLGLGGCGHQHHTERQAVATYVRQVNQVESQLAHPLAAVTRAAGDFARKRARAVSPSLLVLAAHQRSLLSSLGEIRRLRVQLAALPAPPAATRLRSQLLALVDRQAAMTRQVSKLIVFLPQFETVLRPLTPAIARLESVLAIGQARGPAAVAAVFTRKATALRQFKATIDGLILQLRRLDPPRVSEPTYRAQLRSLRGMSASAGALAGVLGAGSGSGVPLLLQEFDRAATSSQSARVQRAQIAAIRAYDSQSAQLNQLARQAELTRLQLADSVR